MLLSFSFSNFHSFSERTEFVMSAGSTRRHLSHIAEIGEVSVLKYSAVYGANAAGKSSLIKAVIASRDMVRGKPVTFLDDEYCRCDPSNCDKPTVFEYEFETDGRFFQFGCSATLSKGEFDSEWLFELSPDHASESLIYSLEKDGDRIVPDWGCFTDEAERTRLDQIRMDSDEDADEDEEHVEHYETLFISKMKGKRFTDLPKLEVLRTVYKWFSNKLRVNYLPSPETDEEILSTCRYLSRYDTDLSGGEYCLESDVSLDIPEQIKVKLKDGKALMVGEGAKVVLEGGKINLYSIHMKHSSNSAEYNIAEESNGTVHAMDLVFNLFCPKEDDATYVIDEFGLAMHPLLVSAILKDYQEFNADGTSQLIMATHHTSVMNLDTLRRDELWFIEKENGISSLYSLEDFAERPDAEVSKRYLEGRYGALPVFTQLEGGAGDAS